MIGREHPCRFLSHRNNIVVIGTRLPVMFSTMLKTSKTHDNELSDAVVSRKGIYRSKRTDDTPLENVPLKPPRQEYADIYILASLHYSVKGRLNIL